MVIKTICILGGTGFVGHSLAARLVAEGYRVVLITRNRERHRDLLVLPTLKIIQANVFSPNVLRNVFDDCDAVINLVGILNESGHNGKGFNRAHVELAEIVVQACQQTGIRHLLHMSALSASENGPSHYLRTKGKAENLVHKNASTNSNANTGTRLAVTSFRPSVIFGPGDSFINRFASLLKLMPGFFPLACSRSRLQPIYVEDVTSIILKCIGNPVAFGKRYNLCGPRAYQLIEILEFINNQMGQQTRIVGLNNRLSWLQAAALEFFRGKPFSIDNYNSLTVDSVCDAAMPAWFGIKPKSMEAVVPAYLAEDKNEKLSVFRSRARRT